MLDDHEGPDKGYTWQQAWEAMVQVFRENPERVRAIGTPRIRLYPSPPPCSIIPHRRFKLLSPVLARPPRPRNRRNPSSESGRAPSLLPKAATGSCRRVPEAPYSPYRVFAPWVGECGPVKGTSH